MLTVTATEMQNNFGKYLSLVQSSKEDILIIKNGKEAARLISREKNAAFLTDSLIGVLKHDYDEDEMREERIKRREGID